MVLAVAPHNSALGHELLNVTGMSFANCLWANEATFLCALNVKAASLIERAAGQVFVMLLCMWHGPGVVWAAAYRMYHALNTYFIPSPSK